jgi:hypothetical protein
VQHHDNYERPNQALSGGNRPPRVAHPDRPPRPAIPDVVAVTAWLERFAGVGITRRVQRDTSISVADERSSVTKALVGQEVLVTIAVATHERVIQHDQREVKRVPLTGLAPALKCRHVVVGTRFCASAPRPDAGRTLLKR